MSLSSAPIGVFQVQPVVLQVIGMGAMAAPPNCTAAGCWGKDQSAVLCPFRDTDFNFGASLGQAGTVTIHIHFTEINIRKFE